MEVKGNLTVTGNVSGDGTNVTNVNALQLEGLSSSDFLRQFAAFLNAVDLNTVFDSGSYRVNDNCTNNPTGTFAALEVWGNSNVYAQQITHFQTGETWMRGYSLSGWTDWLSTTPLFSTVTPALNFGVAPTGYETVSYSRSGNALYLSGVLERTGTGATLSDTLLFTLPVGFRPSNEIQFNISFGTASPATQNDGICRVKTDGTVTATTSATVNTNDIIRLNGVVKLL